MRETLFKGKRKDTGEWVEGSLLGSDVIVPKGVEFYVDEGYLDGLDGTRVYIVDPKTICPYIHREDKNGKKIFEGDIIRYGVRSDLCDKTRYLNGEVIFKGVSFGIWFAPKKGAIPPIYAPLDSVWIESIEVIGNIFDGGFDDSKSAKKD